MMEPIDLMDKIIPIIMIEIFIIVQIVIIVCLLEFNSERIWNE